MYTQATLQHDRYYYGFQILGAVLGEIWIALGTIWRVSRRHSCVWLVMVAIRTGSWPRLGFATRFGAFSRENGSPGSLFCSSQEGASEPLKRGPRFGSFSMKFGPNCAKYCVRQVFGDHSTRQLHEKLTFWLASKFLKFPSHKINIANLPSRKTNIADSEIETPNFLTKSFLCKWRGVVRFQQWR